MGKMLCAALLLLPAVTAAQSEKRTTANSFVEIRSYNLKPGTRAGFHRRFLDQAMPMLKRWNVDVVAFGPSAHDQDSYFLMRAYPSLDARQKSEDAFYGSDEWKKGPREAVLADIDSYTTIVVKLEPAAIRGLRSLVAAP